MGSRMVEIAVPPHPSGGVDSVAPWNLNIGSSVRSSAVSSSSASDLVLNGGIFKDIYPFGAYVTLISDTDLYYHFQPNGAAVVPASATVSYFLPAGVHKDWFCRPGLDDVIVFVQKTAGGRLYRVQTNI